MEKAYKLEFQNEMSEELTLNCCGCSKTEPLHSFGNAATIRAGLGNASYIIIGVEFIKMIASHKIETILDIIAFALSREMIIHETTPLENLLTVAGVVLLFFIRRFLNTMPSERQKEASAQSDA